MTLALLYGASSGALHAVSGPDHLLSLGPAALAAPRGSFRVGLVWGLGHALGTLVLSVPLLVLAELVPLEAFASVSERLADPTDARTILDIAWDAGFTSKSTFNAAFRRQVGDTPSAWRRRHADAAASATTTRTPPG